MKVGRRSAKGMENCAGPKQVEVIRGTTGQFVFFTVDS